MHMRKPHFQTGAPFLTRVPDSLVRARSGSSVEWTCEALGSPKPSLRWLIGNQVLSENGTLRLSSLTPEDEGTYECVALNDAGVAAREVQLYVIGGMLEDEHYFRYCAHSWPPVQNDIF